MSLITAVMVVAGWDSRSNDFFEQIQERLGSIFGPLLKLHKTIGGVESRDLALIIVKSGSLFDPRLMEDVYDYRVDSAKPQYSTPERVAGMSGLGLRKVRPGESKAGEVPSGSWEVLLAPRIILERSLLAEIEPRKLRKGANDATTYGEN
jgi:hypothetical protein